MPKKKELTKAIPVRRSSAERTVLKKLASEAGLSEARLMVTAALMLSAFETREELRAALHIGGQLWQTRTLAIMEVRRIGHQLERLREVVDLQSAAEVSRKLDEALGEVAFALRKLGTTWRGQLQK